jgi:hypothetical protein
MPYDLLIALMKSLAIETPLIKDAAPTVCLSLLGAPSAYLYNFKPWIAKGISFAVPVAFEGLWSTIY